MTSSRFSPWWTLACLLSACATGPAPAPVAYARQLPIGVELAAALAAGALRAEFPFADPVPGAAGAPITPAADGSFTLCYELRDDGSWMPYATARLRVVMPRAWPEGPLPAVEQLPANGLSGCGRAAIARLELHFTGGPGHCRVTGSLPQLADHDLRGLLEGTWDRALSPSPQAPGLGNHNLRTLVAHHLLDEAHRRTRAGDSDGAATTMMQALALGADAPTFALVLGRHALERGDEMAAATQLGRAALTADDPRHRQQAARLLRLATAPAAIRSELWRAGAALGPVVGSDLTGAHHLGHSARRLAPQPAIDYRLQAELHRRSGDDQLALACSLLAHEHAGDAPPSAQRNADLAAAGLIRRLPEASRVATPTASTAVAAPPR